MVLPDENTHEEIVWHTALLRYGCAEHQTLPQWMCNNGDEVLQLIYRHFVTGVEENGFIYRKLIFLLDIDGLVAYDGCVL
jgi:hypothetical protein